MSDLLVGIDLGSQSAKVVVYDARGTVVCEGREPLAATLSPHPASWSTPATTCGRRSASRAGGRWTTSARPARRSSAIGLCGIRFCRALLRADGSLAAPVQSWMDERVARPYEHRDEEVAWVTASSGYLTHRLTGRLRDSSAAYQGQWPIDTATLAVARRTTASRRSGSGPTSSRSWCSRASSWAR